MCGRFGLVLDDGFFPRFNLKNVLVEVNPRYNIAPSQQVPIITLENKNNQLELMRWGLIPFWAKDEKIGYKMINAKLETIQEKPSFRNAFKSRRCLVPATNFYEWKRTDDIKIPYNIYLKDEQYFAMAGLYETWKNPKGEEIRSFTIITTEPNKLMSSIHNRMPVILDPDEEQEWLKPDFDAKNLLDIAKSSPKKKMDAYPISTRVNSPKNEHPSVIERA